MVKRKLDGAENKSSADQETLKSNATHQGRIQGGQGRQCPPFQKNFVRYFYLIEHENII